MGRVFVSLLQSPAVMLASVDRTQAGRGREREREREREGEREREREREGVRERAGVCKA